MKTTDTLYAELTSLFFTTRQIIREKLPSDGAYDPNAWARLEALCFIARSDGPTMQDVASYLHVKAPSATSLVAHLLKTELVTRKGTPNDRRVVRIYPTKEGKKVLLAYHKRSVRALKDVFSKLNETQVRELTLILRRVEDLHRE